MRPKTVLPGAPGYQTMHSCGKRQVLWEYSGPDSWQLPSCRILYWESAAHVRGGSDWIERRKGSPGFPLIHRGLGHPCSSQFLYTVWREIHWQVPSSQRTGEIGGGLAGASQSNSWRVFVILRIWSCIVCVSGRPSQLVLRFVLSERWHLPLLKSLCSPASSICTCWQASRVSRSSEVDNSFMVDKMFRIFCCAESPVAALRYWAILC